MTKGLDENNVHGRREKHVIQSMLMLGEVSLGLRDFLNKLMYVMYIMHPKDVFKAIEKSKSLEKPKSQKVSKSRNVSLLAFVSFTVSF